METNYNKTLLWISIVFFILFGAIFGIQWNKTNENISEIKKQNRDYFEKIKTIKEYGPFQIDYQNLNDKQVIISPNEIEKINKHINTLTEQVYNESNRAQILVDKDIDRLNLYMAIGIGFLTIIGIFVPIVINVLNYQDLKDKIKELNNKFAKIPQEEIKKAIKDASTAISDSNKALASSEEVKGISNAVKKIKTDIEISFPKVSTLILQHAIIRYLNTVPYLVMNFEEGQYIDLIETLKEGFCECQNNNKHSIIGDKTLKSTILDFAQNINSPRNHMSFLNRDISNRFIELAKKLNYYANINDVESEKDALSEINSAFENIIESIKNYYAKTEPAA